MTNTDVRRMNLFNQVTEIDELDMLKDLKTHMNKRTLVSYKHYDWFYNLMDEVLNYNEKDIERPNSAIESLYDVFVDDYRFDGKVYRGYVDDLTFDLEYDRLVSFSANLEIAKGFANSGYFDNIVIEQEVEYGFNLCKFIKDLCEIDDNFLSICEEYFREEEVLCCLQENHRIIYKNNEKVN